MDTGAETVGLGQIVLLNGAPRSGKSSIAAVLQDTSDGIWMKLGVDTFIGATPKRYRPGVGLRPGEPDHPTAAVVPVLYAAMYESIAAHSRLGINVVADVAHHESNNTGVLADCARRMAGLPALFVGVICPIDEIMRRRNEGAARGDINYAAGTPDEPIPAPVQRWQDEIHRPWTYDLEVDTSAMSPQECARNIQRRLTEGPPGSALRLLTETNRRD